MPGLRVGRLRAHKMGELESNGFRNTRLGSRFEFIPQLSHFMGKNLMGMSRSKVSELIHEVMPF